MTSFWFERYYSYEMCVADESKGGNESMSGGEGSHEEESGEPPAIVVYLVEPFTLGSDSSDLQRLACLGLLRCFNTVLAALPDTVRANITLQVSLVARILYIPIHSIHSIHIFHSILPNALMILKDLFF